MNRSLATSTIPRLVLQWFLRALPFDNIAIRPVCRAGNSCAMAGLLLPAQDSDLSAPS